MTSTRVASAPARTAPSSAHSSGTTGIHARLVRSPDRGRRARTTVGGRGAGGGRAGTVVRRSSARSRSGSTSTPSSSSSELQHRYLALRIDATELVALVRVAAAVECPAVARAHELVADDEALREIVVEMRARSGARSRARRSAPATRRTRGRRPRRRPLRRPAARRCRAALSRLRRRRVDDARQFVERRSEATALPSTWHRSGAFVRSPLSCAAIPASRSSVSTSLLSNVRAVMSIPEACAISPVVSESHVMSSCPVPRHFTARCRLPRRQYAAGVQSSVDRPGERGRVSRGDVRVIAAHDDVVDDRVADREARAYEMVEVRG